MDEGNLTTFDLSQIYEKILRVTQKTEVENLICSTSCTSFWRITSLLSSNVQENEGKCQGKNYLSRIPSITSQEPMN